MKLLKIIFFLSIFIVVVIVILVINIMKRPPETKPSAIKVEQKKPLVFRGSIPYWDQDRAVASFKANVSKFNYISLFWYYLDENGNIKRYSNAKEDQELIRFAHENNVKVSALITNLPEDGSDEENWNSERVEAVIKDTESRKKHILEISNKLDELNFDGINIDYEQVDKSQKENFSLFINELKQNLAKKNKFVGVALHPKTAEEKSGEEISYFQDWKALGKAADQLYIMSYGEHTDEDLPGPIASENWLKQIIGYSSKVGIPKEKIFLGTGLYGYSWPKDSDESATGLTFDQIEQIIKTNSLTTQMDQKSKAPYFNYSKENQEYEVWFENAQSIDSKVQLAYKNGLAGVSFWRLGGEDPLIWGTIKPSY